MSAKVTHGMSRTRTYNSWTAMLQRVRGSSDESHQRKYAGITLDDPRWERFEHFFADMGERPANTTLDRRDGTKGYSKQNCRWATCHEQNRNRRGNLMICIGGVTKTASEWAHDAGLTQAGMSQRWYRGDRGDALLRPSRKRPHRT